MIIKVFVGAVWAILMVRAGVAEFRYYRSVRLFEPSVWAQLGKPVFPRTGMVFVSKRGREALSGIADERVKELAASHRQASLQFIAYVVLVLVASIAYFKFANI
ncbi:MAG: hypothetical protein RI942_987 [Pseudomonadota bacterium]|jgi:hypothetical protein